MTHPNQFDQATDILKSRVNSAYAEMHKNYQNTNPYRQQPSDPKERIYQFSQFTPQDFVMARRTFGDDVVNQYIANIQKLQGRIN